MIWPLLARRPGKTIGDGRPETGENDRGRKPGKNDGGPETGKKNEHKRHGTGIGEIKVAPMLVVEARKVVGWLGVG